LKKVGVLPKTDVEKKMDQKKKEAMSKSITSKSSKNSISTSTKKIVVTE